MAVPVGAADVAAAPKDEQGRPLSAFKGAHPLQGRATRAAGAREAPPQKEGAGLQLGQRPQRANDSALPQAGAQQTNGHIADARSALGSRRGGAQTKPPQRPHSPNIVHCAPAARRCVRTCHHAGLHAGGQQPAPSGLLRLLVPPAHKHLKERGGLDKVHVYKPIRISRAGHPLLHHIVELGSPHLQHTCMVRSRSQG